MVTSIHICVNLNIEEPLNCENNNTTWRQIEVIKKNEISDDKVLITSLRSKGN